MTRDIEAQARRYAGADSEVEAISPRWGPASIEGHLEDELAAVATLETVAQRAGDYDGVIIACYGDPGLYAAREVSPVPVVGIAEASMLMACMVAHRFSVVTVLPRVRPLIEDVVARYGLSGRCASVRATSLAVLDIERDPDAAQREITVEAGRAIEADGAEAICLGCAGMGPLDRHVKEALDVPVIDGVAAAVKMLEALTGYGLATSRVAAFKRPEPKELLGETDVLHAFRAAPAPEPLRTTPEPPRTTPEPLRT
jgi:allantoin racemase